MDFLRYTCTFFFVCFCLCYCAGEMGFDLDNILDSGGAKRSKRPRGSRKSERLTKVLKRTKKTPPPPAPSAMSSAVEPTPQVRASTTVELQPPIMVHSTLGPPLKKPSASTTRKLSVSTHIDEYVVDNAAGSHGASLGSDILSRVGQSFSGFDTPHWKFLNNARDCNTLYEKSVELTVAALAVSAQLNYKLNNEIHSSRSYAQEAKDLQLKLNDELKATKAKVETGAEELRAKSSKLEKLNARLPELEEENARVKETNAKLEEEKAATFEIMEGEKSRLLEEFKEKKDRAIDMAMYRIWANNVDLDTSFLGPLEAKLVAQWQARLDDEETARDKAERARGNADAEKAKENAPS
ncbi:uncharacterized protein LOC133829082 [Humulus lupulus]|uniref:uncharacterized protein LOC133829082 n=1 Tax=Humulus lupulus TaxID=3486 RepID=UPI002B409776|nr:uncharacterized protein LOC133829082 [Humulus lupulus]